MLAWVIILSSDKHAYVVDQKYDMLLTDLNCHKGMTQRSRQQYMKYGQLNGIICMVKKRCSPRLSGWLGLYLDLMLEHGVNQ